MGKYKSRWAAARAVQSGQWHRERTEAFLSLDEAKIRAYMKKYCIEIPEHPVFWFAVHKAITACTSLPIDFRRKSAAWLEVRGSRSLDDGELTIR